MTSKAKNAPTKVCPLVGPWKTLFQDASHPILCPNAKKHKNKTNTPY